MTSSGREIVWDMCAQTPELVIVERSKLLCECGAELLAYFRVGAAAIECPSCARAPEIELIAEDLSPEADLYEEEGPDLQVYVVSQPPTDL